MSVHSIDAHKHIYHANKVLHSITMLINMYIHKYINTYMNVHSILMHIHEYTFKHMCSSK